MTDRGAVLLTRSEIAALARAELGEALTGAKPGRLDGDEIIVFDSTGAAFQDLAAAAMIFERAKSAGMGEWIDLQQ